MLKISLISRNTDLNLNEVMRIISVKIAELIIEGRMMSRDFSKSYLNVFMLFINIKLSLQLLHFTRFILNVNCPLIGKVNWHN